MSDFADPIRGVNLYYIAQFLGYGNIKLSDMEKLSSSLMLVPENPEKRPKFGISPLQKFDNANLLAEDFSLFLCLFDTSPNQALHSFDFLIILISI